MDHSDLKGRAANDDAPQRPTSSSDKNAGEEQGPEPQEPELEDEFIADDDVGQVVDTHADAAEPASEDDEGEEGEEGDGGSVDGGEREEVDGADGPDEEEDLEDDSVQGFFVHKEPVYAVAVHPCDPHLIASGGGDDTLYLWRSDTGETLHHLTGHTDSVICVAFSHSNDGMFVASAGMDGKVRVYKSATGEFVVELEGPDELVWIDWHPKGNILLGGASDATTWMWAVPSGTCMNVFAGHAAPVTAGQFTPDGKKVVSVSDDASFILWDPKTAAAIFRLSGEDARFHTDPVTCVAVNKDSTLALTGSEDGTARLINLQSGTILTSLENHSASVEAAAFCDVLPLVATAGADGQISIWDVQTFHLRTTLRPPHVDAVTRLVWHKNSPLLTSCSADKTVRTWDARTGQCVSKQGGHQAALLALAVTPDGKQAVSGGDDGVCLVFDLS